MSWYYGDYRELLMTLFIKSVPVQVHGVTLNLAIYDYLC